MYKAAYTTDIRWLLELVLYLKKKVIPCQSRTVYEGRNRILALSGMGMPEEINLKIYREPGFFKSIIYGWFRPGKAKRAFDYSRRLRDLGVPTPRPYSYLEIFSPLHTLTRSYYISEQLPPEWQEIRYMEERPDYPAMVEALADWVAAIHAKGVLIKDLSPGNILFRRTAEGYEFCMVDVNRMGFSCHNRHKQLYRAGWLMNSESSSLDFARCYAAASGMNIDMAEQTVLQSYRRLQRRAARKKRK